MSKTASNKRYRQAKSPTDYILQRISKEGECWLWLQGVDKDGYGQCQSTKYGRRFKCSRSHQLAYIAWKGDYDRKLFICHTCHTPRCCNPNHLYVGTALQNNQDMIKANRQRYPKGEESGNNKLTWKQVKQIRNMKGMKNCFQVGQMYNISFGHVCRIWRNERYLYEK